VFLHQVGSMGHVVCFGASAQETSTHYFSCSSVFSADLTKSTPGHVMLKVCFYIRWDMWVTQCVLVCTGHETSTHYFSCPGGPGADHTKSASRHIMPILCFYIRWDLLVK
jgi:hypothetical protein